MIQKMKNSKSAFQPSNDHVNEVRFVSIKIEIKINLKYEFLINRKSGHFAISHSIISCQN